VSVALDSSVWIELWKRPDARERIDAAIEHHGGDVTRIVVPSTVVFETQRWLIRHVEQEHVIDGLAALVDEHELVPVDASIARLAALTSVTTGLAHADATILAATRSRHAHLLTFDADFAGLPDVTVLEH
jgi:predicted nucleic acid-binding protein